MYLLLCFILCVLTRRWLSSLEKAPPLLPMPNTHQLILHTRLKLSAANACAADYLSSLPKLCQQMIKQMHVPTFICVVQIMQSQHIRMPQVKE